MPIHTEIPLADGLYWYHTPEKDSPEPVLIDHGRYGHKMKSFNGKEQAWLAKGGQLVGPVAPPSSADQSLATLYPTVTVTESELADLRERASKGDLYEKLRKLKPAQYQALCDRRLACEGAFDDLVAGL
ncbi:hypothetical protein LP417_35580 (plasmid) [Polaromonas sp. P1-6]|nr:hypothetical protein LP417_35580 [Polaromonas sp. P1-6]